jgi:DNA-binding GntR family transcriptional regulator
MSKPQPTSTPETADNTLNRHLAYQRFQQLLMAGEIAPGQDLSQREIVNKLGISVGALRELLPRLESEGLLAVLPQRGIQITRVDLRMIRESFQMRLAYEREATIFATENVSDELFQKQRARHVQLLDQASGRIDPSLLAKAQKTDSDFHDFLISSTGNETMIRAYAIVAIRLRLVELDRVRLNPQVLAPALADHIRIIDAMLARKKLEAIEAMEAHILHAKSRALSV